MLNLKKFSAIVRLGLAVIFCPLFAHAQKADSSRTLKLIRPSLIRPGSDSVSLPTNIIESYSVGADSIKNDSAATDIESTVEYGSEDSSIMNAEKKIVNLYGNAHVTYGAINLTAAYIRVDLETNEIFAEGVPDSTGKKKVGLPVFQDGNETYDAEEIRYNFKSKRGIVKGIITQQGDGNIRSQRVKREADESSYAAGSIYTTCNLEHPHYYIKAPKIKMVGRKEIISGPFHMVISDVPLPLGLPFGFIPIPKNKEAGTSGILFPQYGEEPNGRGFFLRNGGYYFALSEYINAAVTGEIYSTGSWGLGIASTYMRRYRYSGNLSFQYRRTLSSDEVARQLNQNSRNDFTLSWSHAPKARGNSSFSANVNINSGNFNTFSAASINQYISNVAASSVQYNKTFGQWARAGASVRVNQNFGQVDPRTQLRSNGETDVSTNFNFGINQFSPLIFRGNARGKWYESFRVGMDFNGSYQLSNQIPGIDTSLSALGIRLSNDVDTSRLDGENLQVNAGNIPTILNNGIFQGNYSIPISLPNIKLLRFVNLTPGFSLSGQVYSRSYNYTYTGSNEVRIDTVNRLSSDYSYSFSAGLNTRFYGIFQVGGKRLEAIRHTVAPSLSFSYTPDFTKDQYNFYQTIQIDETGREMSFSRFEWFGAGALGKASGNVSFALKNQFEMKLRTKSDTADEQFEKLSLLDNLGLIANYDILADSMNLSLIGLNANTRIAKKINMNYNMSFDPYAIETRENGSRYRVKEYAVTQGQGLARLNNMNLTVSTSFAPKSAKKNTETNQQKTGATAEQLEYVDQNPEQYVDFTIPWSLSLSYNFNWAPGSLSQRPPILQTVNFNGDLSLTPKWKLSLTSGFDFTQLRPSITQVSINRDLHCWDMSISWTPYAGNNIRVSTYSFELRVKSSILQDLKITRRRSAYDSGVPYGF